jgi:transposase
VAALQGPGRGGRHRQNLSLAQEQELLAQFFAMATQGSVLEARAVRAVYETWAGHSVPKSTVYRLLARHGWRKLAPRPRHPKADPVIQEAFKKSFGAWWSARANGGPHRACVCD